MEFDESDGESPPRRSPESQHQSRTPPEHEDDEEDADEAADDGFGEDFDDFEAGAEDEDFGDFDEGASTAEEDAETAQSPPKPVPTFASVDSPFVSHRAGHIPRCIELTIPFALVCA